MGKDNYDANLVSEQIRKEVMSKKLGMDYDEFCNLDYDEQRKIMDAYKDKKKKNNFNVQYGASNRYTRLTMYQKGDKVVLSGGPTVLAQTSTDELIEQTENKGLIGKIRSRIKR